MGKAGGGRADAADATERDAWAAAAAAAAVADDVQTSPSSRGS